MVPAGFASLPAQQFSPQGRQWRCRRKPPAEGLGGCLKTKMSTPQLPTTAALFTSWGLFSPTPAKKMATFWVSVPTWLIGGVVLRQPLGGVPQFPTLPPGVGAQGVERGYRDGAGGFRFSLPGLQIWIPAPRFHEDKFRRNDRRGADTSSRESENVPHLHPLPLKDEQMSLGGAGGLLLPGLGVSPIHFILPQEWGSGG